MSDDAIDPKSVETFVKSMLVSYESLKPKRGFATFVPYSDMYGSLTYTQIVKRIGLPKRFFFVGDRVDNSIIASDFARAIVDGERDFVLRSLDLDKETQHTNITNFSYEELLKVLVRMDNPTDIFIPIKPFFKKFYTWATGNTQRIRFEYMKDPILLAGNKEIQVHWLVSKTGLENIYILDKNRIKVIQKKYSDSKDPAGVDIIDEYRNLSKSSELMIYFAKHREDVHNFDFVFRTILSNPTVQEGSAIVVSVLEPPID